jgi:dienelactone hydrolase
MNTCVLTHAAALVALLLSGGGPAAKPGAGAVLFTVDRDLDVPVSVDLVEPAVPPTKPYSVRHVRLASAQPSGVPSNDTIPGRDYVPAVPPRGGVVILPIWNGPREGGPEDVAARYLAARGFRAFVLPMAYQWERAPPGERSGRLTISADLDRTRDSIVQSVKDARRIAALLDREDGSSGRIGVLGVSLGGFVGALTYSVAPEFRAGVFALAGAGVSEVLLHESRETRRVIADLRARGIDVDEVRRRCREFDPETYASPERGEGLLLYGGLFDRIVPPESTLRLSRAFGDARIRWVPAGHHTAALFLPDFLECAAAHFERFFR